MDKYEKLSRTAIDRCKKRIECREAKKKERMPIHGQNLKNTALQETRALKKITKLLRKRKKE